jgi:hypothetical protein
VKRCGALVSLRLVCMSVGGTLAIAFRSIGVGCGAVGVLCPLMSRRCFAMRRPRIF